MAKTIRGSYSTCVHRIYAHLDWHLKMVFNSLSADVLPISVIREEIRGRSGVKVHRETILKYNVRQFFHHQTAPLEWIGDNNFRLNENYYEVLKEKVFAPRVGKRGRPKKYTKEEEIPGYYI